MSRCANWSALKRNFRRVSRPQARRRCAEINDMLWNFALAPVRCGKKLIGHPIGASLCCVGQGDPGHARASLREMVRFAWILSKNHRNSLIFHFYHCVVEQTFSI